ncbi:GPI-linked NAD(P)(+)--arginine ADP-ribosyltransferase 1-like [Perca fluviatilis]|uniref:GPI-linked NAD(P)(+)--arginine ADP-ribosyltransferase 1-like n=1 Tax=Perca fluviatilis TaxID=8168 RepID=UPI0019665F60|nr:GPI-linked NAD(P)(+)--arginine ADP-ribosyltransferase 1-like [Perca fluviatilis]
MALMVVLAAVLLTYGVSPGIGMRARESDAVAGKNSVFPLDMAENSVDDMYDGCEDKMKQRVTEDLKNEKNNNPNFTEVWDRSENEVHWSEELTEVLTKNQSVAIRTYTDEGVYGDFNAAVRTQGPRYNTTFGYHALHFLLTTAIQDIRAFDKNECLTGYRRVNVSFSQDVENTSIRFGSFTSASLGGYADEDLFGNKSCFEILTCMGANITLYSIFPDESEVLIPPHEVFNVVVIKNRSTMQPDLPCEVVYKVRSTGYVSKLNCALFPK